MRLATAALALAACGGDDAMTIIDAPAQSPDAQDPARCLIPGDYGDVGAKTGTQGAMGGVTATFTLDPGPPRDTFFLKMVSGRGVFAGGIVPGTFTIAGADTEYNACGLCVHVIADIVTGVGPTKFYFANAGMVTLTSVGSPITGTAQNLTFREVDIGTGQPISGGCTATLGSISFSTM